MKKKIELVSGQKRKRGHPRGTHKVVSEQAIAYGITVPVLTDSGERYLSPNDIGKILNISGAAVKLWVYRRKIPAVKLANGFWKVTIADFERFLKARTEFGRRLVLVTDGSKTGSSEIVEAVKTLGHEAILAHNYSDALLKALDHFPALFVICIAQGDPECWKFADRIRANKNLRRIPILFIGGTSISSADTERAVEYYAQGILSRPLTVDVLRKEIDRILQRSM